MYYYLLLKLSFDAGYYRVNSFIIYKSFKYFKIIQFTELLLRVNIFIPLFNFYLLYYWFSIGCIKYYQCFNYYFNVE